MTTLTATELSALVRENLPVATIADLKELAAPDNQAFQEVQGYYTAGDGGGGSFWWDSASSASDNGGTIIAPDAGGTGRWRRVDSDTVTALQFGAKGDGTTDARATLNSFSGLSVTKLVPSGTYIIASTVTLSGVWRFEQGASLKPSSGIVVVLDSTFVASAPQQWRDTSAGGSFTAQAGSSGSHLQEGAAGQVKDIINGYAGNSIAAGSGTNVIAGGGNSTTPNHISAATQYCNIQGGYDNKIEDCIASTIGGGAHHVIENPATHAFIGGGSFHSITAGDYGVIAGGTLNTVSASNATVGGGTANSATANDATVAGGNDNDATGLRASIGGGTANDAAANDSTISGGATNVITATNGARAAIGGGSTNSIGAGASAVNATIAGGLDCDAGETAISDYAAIGGGRSNKINASYATIPGGRGNLANADYSTAVGRDAKADKINQVVHGGEKFVAEGDCQTSVLVGRRQTTNSTPTELRLGSAFARFTIPSDTTWAFNIMVVARRTDADGESAFYWKSGCIDNNAGTTALVGAVADVVTPIEDTAAWDLAVTADNTNDALSITATGENSKTINWVARVTLVEVTG